MSHLGDRVSALVDGQLSHCERDRLLAHVAHCASCRDEVDTARALKARLSSLSGPAPSGRLTARLLAMAEPGDPLPPPRPPMPGGPARSSGPARFLGPQALRRVASPVPVRRRVRRAGLVAASVTAVTLSTGFLLGGQPSSDEETVVPPVGEYAVEHAATSSGVPFTESAVSAVTAGGVGALWTVGGSRVGPPTVLVQPTASPAPAPLRGPRVPRVLTTAVVPVQR